LATEAEAIKRAAQFVAKLEQNLSCNNSEFGVRAAVSKWA